jgi:uncharacterized protein with beta-barrel porin domain
MMKSWLTLFVLLIPTLGQANLTNGKYGTAQVFDVQRSPAFPQAGQNFAISNFDRPYSDLSGNQYDIDAGGYIQFFYVGGDIGGGGETGCNVGIRYYPASGGGPITIANAGTVWGLAADGFFHASSPGDYGTYVSNNRGFAIGSNHNYTPSAGIAQCSDLTAYAANPNPLGVGQTWDGPTNEDETDSQLRANLGQDAAQVDAIVNHQAQAPITYQMNIIGMVFTRMSELRRVNTMTPVNLGRSRVNLEFNLTERYAAVEEILQNKANQYYQDTIGYLFSALNRDEKRRWNFWADGTLAIGRQKATSDSEKVKLSSRGLTFGIDRVYGLNWTLGGALAVGFSDSDIGPRNTVEDKYFSVIGYTTYRYNENFFLDTILGISHLSSKSKRFVIASSDVASGSRDGIGISASTQLNYEHQLTTTNDQLWRLIPNFKVDFNRNKLDNYRETGSTNSLEFSNQVVKRWAYGFGGRVEKIINRTNYSLSPQLSLNYKRNISSNSRGTVTSLNNPNLGSMSISAANVDRDFFEIGSGLTFLWKSVHSLTGAYNYEQSFTNDSYLHRLNMRYNYSF